MHKFIIRLILFGGVLKLKEKMEEKIKTDEKEKMPKEEKQKVESKTNKKSTKQTKTIAKTTANKQKKDDVKKEKIMDTIENI